MNFYKFKELALIALLVGIVLGRYMNNIYPYEHPVSGTMANIAKNANELREFYTDSCYFKKRIYNVNSVCPSCNDILREDVVRSNLSTYYYSDFGFIICYIFLFYYIFCYFTQKGLSCFKFSFCRNLVWILLIITACADVGENIKMLNYISHNFEVASYSQLISYLNILKMAGFIILLYLLVIRHFLVVMEGFINLLKALKV